MIKTINGLVLKDKKLLLFKENLTWILPGGKPQNGESDIETLSREFKEEASGAEINIRKYYGSFMGLSPHSFKLIESVSYFADLKRPDAILVPSNEINEILFAGYFAVGKLQISDITKKVILNLTKKGYM